MNLTTAPTVDTITKAITQRSQFERTSISWWLEARSHVAVVIWWVINPGVKKENCVANTYD